MSRSVLLQLARDSIVEVFQAKRSIDKKKLLQEHPLLHQKIATCINIYLDNELRGSASSSQAKQSLLENIIQNAKHSSFEDKNFTPLSTSEYLYCEVEVVLLTNDEKMSERDQAILKNDNPKLETILRKK